MAMAALAINRHCWRNPTVMQTSDLPQVIAEGRSHSAVRALRATGLISPVNVEAFKASLLSYGAVNHGFISLFVNLLTSSRHAPSKHSRGSMQTWEDAYLEGTKFEIYVVRLDHSSQDLERKSATNNNHSTAGRIRGEAFIGASWVELSSAVHLNSEALLLGMLDDDNENGLPCLNPGIDYQVSTQTRCFFVIANNLKCAVRALQSAATKKLTRPANQKQAPDTGFAANVAVGANAAATAFSNPPAADATAAALIRLNMGQTNQQSGDGNIVMLLPARASVSAAALFISSLIEIDERVQIVVVAESVELVHMIEEARDGAVPYGLPIRHEIGCPKDPVALNRAGVHEAKTVVLLAEECTHADPEYDYVSYQDRETILAGVQLDNISKEHNAFEMFSLYELCNDSSVAFLQQHSGADQFVNIGRPRSVFLWPLFAAGRVFTHAILDTLIVPLSANPEEASVWTALFGLNAEEFSLDLVPSEMWGKTYGELFISRCADGETLLGLYRPSGTFGSSLPFTSTNPSKNTVLVPKDQIFAIKPSRNRTEASSKGKRVWGWSGSWD
jgi:hypothetical protein